MSKRIITAETIRLTRKKGLREICVAVGDIITPQAKDDAKDFGLVFVVGDTMNAQKNTESLLSHHTFSTQSPDVLKYNHSMNGNSQSLMGNHSTLQSNSGVMNSSGVSNRLNGYESHIKTPVDALKSRNFINYSGFGQVNNQTGIQVKSKDRTMIFLTEEDVRQRGCPQGATFVVHKEERLTPSAAEYLRQCNAKIVESDPVGASASHTSGGSVVQKAIHTVSTGGVQSSIPSGSDQTKTVCSADACCPGMTHLDAAHLVAKSHPRIEFRGKLDSVLAAMVVVQTQFDFKGRLPEFLNLCLQDTAIWIENILRAEVSGSALPAHTVGGMPADVIHAVSRNPQQYLGIDHIMPSVQHGPNLAFLNWLRALLREAEVLGAKSGIDRADILEGLNRLSSAVYVLMLFTVAVEKGLDISKFGAK